MTARGRFITLEGGEGVGKSTQAARLADALRERGHDVILTREPGGTPNAEAVRGLLMTGDADRWTPAAEALLFAAARADHVERVILPALARGAWVVCDRFIDSTRAYQGGAGGMSDADILTLHRIGSGGLMPDRTLLLLMTVAGGALRARLRDGNETDRFGAKLASYFDAVADRFLNIVDTEPQRVRIVDADAEPDVVQARCMGALDNLL